jgi:hypothetical protein
MIVTDVFYDPYKTESFQSLFQQILKSSVDIDPVEHKEMIPSLIQCGFYIDF